jgi:hypothetical protein
MRRHCPRCDKPAAIVITQKTHDTELGNIVDQEWRCEDCFYHFKLSTPFWHQFIIFFGVVMIAAGVGAALGFVAVEEGQRTLMVILLCSLGAGAIAYGLGRAKLHKKARPVSAAAEIRRNGASDGSR